MHWKERKILSSTTYKLQAPLPMQVCLNHPGQGLHIPTEPSFMVEEKAVQNRDIQDVRPEADPGFWL